MAILSEALAYLSSSLSLFLVFHRKVEAHFHLTGCGNEGGVIHKLMLILYKATMWTQPSVVVVVYVSIHAYAARTLVLSMAVTTLNRVQTQLTRQSICPNPSVLAIRPVMDSKVDYKLSITPAFHPPLWLIMVGHHIDIHTYTHTPTFFLKHLIYDLLMQSIRWLTI